MYEKTGQPPRNERAHWNSIEEIGNLKRPIAKSEIESVKKTKKKTSGNKPAGQDDSLGNSTKHIENLHQSFPNSSKKLKREKQYQNNL